MTLPGGVGGGGPRVSSPWEALLSEPVGRLIFGDSNLAKGDYDIPTRPLSTLKVTTTGVSEGLTAKRHKSSRAHLSLLVLSL